MIYLAQPYTDPDKAIREKRYNAALQIVADYTRLEFLIYSPIVHYHPVAVRHNLPGDFSFWRQLNFDALERCTEIWVLPLKGWEASLGLRAEIQRARKLGLQQTVLNEDVRRYGWS